MMGIYAIRNKVNRKAYIGQSRNIQKRFKQHLDALERGIHHSKKLQKDFDELGADKFALELLELCTSEQLDQKEMEWITKFDSIQNGYNIQDPSARKTWLGFKRQKRPMVTVRGELSRIIRDFALETVEEFRNWLIGHKKEVRVFLACLALIAIAAVALIVVITIGYFVRMFFGDGALIFFIAFIMASAILTAMVMGVEP